MRDSLLLCAVLGSAVRTAEAAAKYGTEFTSKDRLALFAECTCFNATTGERCPSSADSSCEDYVKALGNELWPSILLWLLFIIAAIWRCCRCCCSTCGSSVPSAGCCGGKHFARGGDQVSDSGSRFSGYSGVQRLVFRVLLMSTVLVGVAVIGPGIDLNRKVTDAVKDLGGSLTRGITDFSDASKQVLNDLELMAPTEIPESEKQTVRDATKDIDKIVKQMQEDVIDNLYKYNHGEDGDKFANRESITFFYGAVVLVTMALITLIGIFGVWRFKLPGIVFSWMVVIMTISLIVCLVHHSLAMVSSDMCDEYPAIVTDGVLKRLENQMGCYPGSTEKMGSIAKTLSDAKTRFRARMCASYVPGLCQVFACSTGTLCATNPGPTIPVFFGDLFNSTLRQPPAPAPPVSLTGCSAPCTIAKCATQCQSGSLQRQLSASVVDEYNRYGHILTNFEVEILPIAQCLTLRQLSGLVRSSFCHGFSSNIGNIFVVVLLSMLILLVAGVVMTIGTKRFRPDSKASAIHPVALSIPASNEMSEKGGV